MKGGRALASTDIVNDFALVDLDGNGKVTAQEWRRAFSDQYQAGYLEAFRQGYAEGYGPRR